MTSATNGATVTCVMTLALAKIFSLRAATGLEPGIGRNTSSRRGLRDNKVQQAIT